MKIFSPAKINLYLKIKDKRADGYHNIETLICPIEIFDTLSFIFGQKKVSVESNPEICAQKDNLAFKAANLFFKEAKIKAGVKIVINKKIPAGAGLGGGSSNAAAVLSALNKYYQAVSIEKLEKIGLKLGADVPFFIRLKPAIAKGIGEKLYEYKGLYPFYIVVVYPGFEVSTLWAYRKFDEVKNNLGLTNIKKRNKYPFFTDQKNRIYIENDLEEAIEPCYPQISDIKKAFIQNKADKTLMTGSGSAVFGIFKDFKTAKKAFEYFLTNRRLIVFNTKLIV
ncbi:MAG: 4-(cytidine 5'-diphospho)-2-C-methyl-D-erythritol kinase [Deltaproteobacteria bacterium]|nr:4-(cytidine 5'-diphospho)-2-C-methyl-D-erythritol kinase [Deltaproteobacteria bacterium]